jgi:hypothetical protein
MERSRRVWLRSPYSCWICPENYPPAGRLICASQVVDLAGRSGRARTCDPRFWRPVLYQLSYTPVRTLRHRPIRAVSSIGHGRMARAVAANGRPHHDHFLIGGVPAHIHGWRRCRGHFRKRSGSGDFRKPCQTPETRHNDRPGHGSPDHPCTRILGTADARGKRPAPSIAAKPQVPRSAPEN